MDNARGKTMFALLMAAIIFTGCVSSEQSANPQNGGRFQPGFGNKPGFGGNLSPQQREQSLEQRMHEAKAACNGRAENDSCEMQTPRGSANGTCKMQNASLLCAFERASGRGAFRNEQQAANAT